jgi:hypothetical protein
VVWDGKLPPAEAELAAFSRLARATGFSLLISHGHDYNLSAFGILQSMRIFRFLDA